MINFVNKYFSLGIVFLSFLTLSCSSDLNFEQTNDLVVEPVIVSNLASFDIPTIQFFSGGIEKTQLIDIPNFDLFKDLFFKDNLTKVELFFEFNNTIKRDFEVDLVLLDANDSQLYVINIPIPAYTGTTKVFPYTEVFENNLDILNQTRKMFFRITLLPGTSLNQNSLASLKLRSYITAYFKVE